MSNAKFVKTIEYIEGLRNSAVGNRRYRFTFSDGDSHTSRPDSAFVVAVGNPGMREGCKVRITLNRAGYITHMEPVTS